MKKLRFVIFLFCLVILFSCGPREEQLAEGIKYLGGSDKKAEEQFKKLGLDPMQIAKERLMKEFPRLLQGINEKDGDSLVALSSPELVHNIQRTYNLSFTEALDGWRKSFETGKAWCEYDLLFKDKIVSYEIEPSQADEDKEWKYMRYSVYLRKEGQMGKLTLENSHVLVFESQCYKGDGECGRFSIDTFVNHCPILSPEEEDLQKDFEHNHPEPRVN
ncbi:laminin-binding protein Lsa27 [Leptospira adleri]|uniref:laminin-binding protein Lsa27 n=1 Tax=Leptospira adleri TaxID=2023186 RepID=UPI001083594B|nr:hypothetical protein [Leptospira adleri]TGM60640.1 hypothetical protein EHQ97_02660 [Leptospira adleri]